MNKEKLNASYASILQLRREINKAVAEFIEQGLSMLGGKAVLVFKYHSWDEAELDGGNFDDQFPVSLLFEDRHGDMHKVYITALYKKDGGYAVDGFDNYSGNWITGWAVCSSTENYNGMVEFIHAVNNPPTEEEQPVHPVPMNVKRVLVGFQFVDNDGCYPSEFGCWDVFRDRTAAERYRLQMLDADEYHIEELWDMETCAQHYHYHAELPRTFQKGEMLYIEDPKAARGEYAQSVTGRNGRYVKVAEDCSVVALDDAVKVKELGMKVGFFIDNEYIFKVDGQAKCPACGQKLCFEHRRDHLFKYYCPHCRKGVAQGAE